MNEVFHIMQALLDILQLLTEVEKSAGYTEDTLQLEITTAEPHYIVFDRYLHKNVYVGDLDGLVAWLNTQKVT